jgi:hypothetical protein
MTHTHTASTTRKLPFGGVVLSICSCGAKKQSDDRAIAGGVLDAEGWHVAPAPEDNTYEMLQSEGYGYGKDASDLLDSHDPRNQD